MARLAGDSCSVLAFHRCALQEEPAEPESPTL